MRPRRERTTLVMKQRARFQRVWYKVYAKEGATTRTIFPNPKQHPAFAKAPFGSRFRVWYKGKYYYARKEARWQENGARVPCLTWEVDAVAIRGR